MMGWILLIIGIIIFTYLSLEFEENEKDILKKIKKK